MDRYDQPDKAGAGSDGGRLGSGTEAWPAPYWTIDAAMAVMTLLLGAEDAGLGALFFGVFHGEAALRRALGVPEHLEVLGAIALGWPLGDDAAPGRRIRPAPAPPARRDHPPRRVVRAASDWRDGFGRSSPFWGSSARTFAGWVTPETS